jgi:hypothetical protein
MDEMVPSFESPPGTPLTFQVTVGFELPLLLAANCCDPPGATFTDDGEIEIEGGGGGWTVEPPPHPTKQLVVSKTITAVVMYFMVSLVSCEAPQIIPLNRDYPLFGMREQTPAQIDVETRPLHSEPLAGVNE